MVNPLIAATGIILALITTICFNLAMVFQKKGLNNAPEINIEGGVKGIVQSFKGLFKNKWWFLGLILGFLGWFPYIVSISMVGVLVTEPVMATGFIVFVIAAVKMLNEKVSLYEYAAIGMLTFSPILIGFAGISGVTFDMYAFILPLVIFLGITLSISFVAFIMSKKTRGSSVEPLYLMLCGGILFALGGTFTNILGQAFIFTGIEFSWYILFEIVFGIFWWDYGHLLVFIGFWGMVTLNLSSLTFYQSAMQKGKATIMYPILDTLALIVPITAGLLVFKQTFENPFLFWLAIGFAMIGSLILSRFQAKIENMGEKDYSYEKAFVEQNK
jgi:hypothetical protein